MSFLEYVLMLSEREAALYMPHAKYYIKLINSRQAAVSATEIFRRFLLKCGYARSFKVIA